VGQITQNGEVRLDLKRDIILFNNLSDLILMHLVNHYTKFVGSVVK